MNRFWLITKIQLINLFKQSKRKKSVVNLGSYTVGVIVMAVVGIYYTNMLFMSLKPSQYNNVPYFMVYTITFLILIMGISTSRGMLFGFKDLDILKAMPFTEREIVFSKIAVYTATEYAYAGSFFIPVIIIYGVKVGAGVLFYILSLLGFLALPLLPLVLASLIGMGLERLSAGKKHADLIRNLTSIIIFLAVYALYMYSTISTGASNGAGFIGMNGYLEKLMVLSKMYMDGAMQGNVVMVLGSMAISIAAYLLFLYFYSGTVMHINSLANQGYHVTNFAIKKVHTNGVFIALFKKERDRFLRNFLYVFNTAFGMIMLVAFAVFLMFKRIETVEVITQLMSENASLSTFISQLMIMLIVFFGQLTCTTSSSISLEGKSLWIMKTLPVSVAQVFWSKMLVNILLICIPSILSLILLGIVFNFSILYIVLGLAFILISSMGISMLGLLLNLAFPKLQYENEQEVIKQSMAAFCAVFIPMLVSIGTAIGFLRYTGDVTYLFYFIIGGYGLLDILMYAILMTYGKEKYLSLI